ncbi:MAG: hypothetical protein GX136_02135 [Clostridiales bacterium]|jgi:hypothetical protein|nr:hypothetical protein [Clostridiales bacterium]
MNQNAEMLNFIYQNSQMGVETIEHLASIVEDEGFKRHLQSKYRGYEEIHRTARKMLNENGYDEKGIGSFEKIRTYLMINLQTLTDKTPSHIAEMLIIGSNMGVINAIRNIRKYNDAEPQIVGLMEKLREFEENNIRQLKAYL